MKVFSPFKAERVGIARIAEKSPAQAYASLSRRNLANAGVSLYGATTPLLLSIGEVARNIVFQQGIIDRISGGKEPGYFKNPVGFGLDTVHTTFNNDHLAQGLLGLAVGLPVWYLGWSIGRGVQSLIARNKERKASKPPVKTETRRPSVIPAAVS